MELKTRVDAEENRQDILITREFDLPVELLFKAHVEPEIVAQWMGTRVLKLEARRHGSWQYETTDPKGNKHGFSGVFHDVVPDQRITRTFEMENGSFGVQLEFLEFERIGNETSRLRMHVVYRSVAVRDQMLQLPFRQGVNMAHNRLQEVVRNLK
jgi:uncharacterized protein YndB with AHSA1/START domain